VACFIPIASCLALLTRDGWSGHGIFEFTHSEYFVVENHALAYVTVTRTGGWFGYTTVDYFAFSGTVHAIVLFAVVAVHGILRDAPRCLSGTSHTRDGDFIGRFGRIRFSPYENLERFTVVVNDDDQYGRVPLATAGPMRQTGCSH